MPVVFDRHAGRIEFPGRDDVIAAAAIVVGILDAEDAGGLFFHGLGPRGIPLNEDFIRTLGGEGGTDASYEKSDQDNECFHNFLFDFSGGSSRNSLEVIALMSIFIRCCRSFEFRGGNNLFGKRFEPRIAAQWIEERINSDPPYVSTGAILITLFKQAKGLFFVAESNINESKAVG